MIDRQKDLLVGFFSVVVGALTAIIIYRHPEQLQAPAWVAYTACVVFVFAGLTIIAYEFALRRTYMWLAVACIAALLVPGAWIAFGPGVHECSVSVSFFSTVGPDLLCRGAFGFGTFIVAALLIWIVLRALRQ